MASVRHTCNLALSDRQTYSVMSFVWFSKTVGSYTDFERKKEMV